MATYTGGGRGGLGGLDIAGITDVLYPMYKVLFVFSFLFLQCAEVTSVPTITESEPIREPEDEPCFKRFKHLSSIISEKLRDRTASRGTTPDSSPFQRELEGYIGETFNLNEEADALDFWVEHEQTYPDLADMAFDILTIPASSTPVERVFSTAGHVSMGKRNRLSGAKLEREVLIKKNKSFLWQL